MGNGFANALRRYGALSSTGILAWVGLACILVWNQCVLYNQRIGVDAGMTTVALSAIRCAFTVALLAVALSPVFKGKVPRWWELASIALMACGGVSLLASNLVGTPASHWLCIVCSAVGITWGGGMWIQLYARFGVRSMFACSILAMALSAVLGVFVCYLPWEIASCLGIILPVASYACFTRSLSSFEENKPANLVGLRLGASCNNDTASSQDFQQKKGAGRRVFAGIALFSFALGVTRGYPSGETLVIPSIMLPGQFFIVLLVCLLLLWWSMRPTARPNAGILWACYIASLALSVFLVSADDEVLKGLGATLLSSINLLQVLMLWLLVCDSAKHSARPPFVGLAAFWLVHLFFREFGRAMVIVFPAQTHTEQVVLLGVVVGLLAISVALLLAGRSPSGALFFSDFEAEAQFSAQAAAAAGSQQNSATVASRASSATAGTAALVANDAAVSTQAEALSRAATSAAAASSLVLDDALWLKDAFGLTARECEVASLLACNKSAASIGEQLFLSKETVRSYTKTIYAKAGVHSKDELARLIATQGKGN